MLKTLAGRRDGAHDKRTDGPGWCWMLLGGWKDGWMDGWLDGWMAAWMDGWLDIWLAGWMLACFACLIVNWLWSLSQPYSSSPPPPPPCHLLTSSVWRSTEATVDCQEAGHRCCHIILHFVQQQKRKKNSEEEEDVAGRWENWVKPRQRQRSQTRCGRVARWILFTRQNSDWLHSKYLPLSLCVCVEYLQVVAVCICVSVCRFAACQSQ